MKKICSIVLLFACSAAVSAYQISSTKAVMPTKKAPNILLFIVNGLRADPPYESDELKAWKRQNLPFQTMMAERGVVFCNHYTNTNGSSPAKSTLHTGQYPNVHGVTQTLNDTAGSEHGLIPYTVPTIGNWLREAGYKTMLKGKWQVAESSIRLNDGTELTTFDVYGKPIASLCDFYLKKNVLCDFGYDGWIGPDPGSRSYLDAGSSVDETVLGRDTKTTDELLVALEELVHERKPWLLVGSYVNPFDVFFYQTADRSVEQWDFTIDETLPDKLFTDDFKQSLTGSLQNTPMAQQLWRNITSSYGFGGVNLFIENILGLFLETLKVTDLHPTNTRIADRDFFATRDAFKQLLLDNVSRDALIKNLLPHVLYTIDPDNPSQIPIGNPFITSFLAAFILFLTSLIETLPIDTGWYNVEYFDFIYMLKSPRYYYTLQKKIDQEMMRVWQSMVSKGMEDNTVVVFTSDHGFMLGAHGLMSGVEYQAYQEAVKVPLMISGPLFPQSSREVDALSSHIDLLPTLLDVAGVNQDKIQAELLKKFYLCLPLPGKSLAPLMKGQAAPELPIYFYTEDNPAHGIIPQPCAVEALVNYVDDTLWKLTHYYDPFGRPQKTCHESLSITHELYDLTHDPMELHNLYGSQGAAEIQQTLQQMLHEAVALYRIIPGYRGAVLSIATKTVSEGGALIGLPSCVHDPKLHLFASS